MKHEIRVLGPLSPWNWALYEVPCFACKAWPSLSRFSFSFSFLCNFCEKLSIFLGLGMESGWGRVEEGFPSSSLLENLLQLYSPSWTSWGWGILLISIIILFLLCTKLFWISISFQIILIIFNFYFFCIFYTTIKHKKIIFYISFFLVFSEN